MSMNFQDPVNPEALAKIKELIGEPVAHDDKTFLFNRMSIIRQQMNEIANVAAQPVTVEVNGDGDIKTMSDGTRYRITASGWTKVE